jgi:hypothetical protein
MAPVIIAPHQLNVERVERLDSVGCGATSSTIGLRDLPPIESESAYCNVTHITNLI